MTEETARELEQENAALKEQVAQKDRRIEELEARLMGALLRLEELERRQRKDSRNSSKPPSSDGMGRKPHTQRKKSGRSSGGQKGHQGQSLLQALMPDSVITHRPEHCEQCECDLQQEVGRIKERRQIHDLPDVRLQVQEHQVEEICCPACQHRTQASFPVGVDAPVQYGPRVQALAVYLSQFQLLPLERTCEVLTDLCQCPLSQGTLVNWIAQAANTLEPTIQQIKTLLLAGSFLHADETGIRIKGLLHWVHVASTQLLTLYGWHRKRGQEALEQMGIWPYFQGRAMHDRWTSYARYPCAHSVCGAHLLRDCLFVTEQEKQSWAQEMLDVLLMMKQVAEHFRAQGAKEVREHWIAQYFGVLASGFAVHAAQAPPETSQLPKRIGRKKQEASKNLLDALLKRADQVLAFLDDLSIPFTNNLAERDLRMRHPCSKRFPGPFAVSKGPQPFASSAAISPPCANKVALCWLRWLLSLMALPSLSHGEPEELSLHQQRNSSDAIDNQDPHPTRTRHRLRENRLSACSRLRQPHGRADDRRAAPPAPGV